MSGTYVYTHVKGQKLERYIATLPSVQGRVHIHAQEIAAVARRELNHHRHDGHAFIEVTHKASSPDWWVVLNDTRGQLAALSIEYGRKPKADGSGGMEGLRILHKAATIPY